MTDTMTRPFDQSIRIAALRIGCLAILPITLFVRPLGQETLIGEMLTQIGLMLIIACILGRFWSILYIGGRKNADVVRSGPYSICRHPLYLFSTLGAVGFGLMLQSLVMAALFGATVFAILFATAGREEAFLEATFGSSYAAYAAATPRMVPNVSLFATDDIVVFGVRHLRNNLSDALVFVALIPLSEALGWLREVGAFPTVSLP